MWRWSDRAHEEASTNGVEAWVYALRGEYKMWRELRREDFSGYDLIILNMNPAALGHYKRLLDDGAGRRAKVVGLYEGDLSLLHERWRTWGEVADRCDMVIAINRHGIGLLGELTSTPVRYIGIPYPVDGVRAYHVPVEERRREVFLCAFLLARPLDYLAARPLNIPMYGYEDTFSRRPRELARHRTFDKLRYVRRAADLYGDPALTVLPKTNLVAFFERASQSLLWMNLDTRYTWGRYVIDAAALGIPVVSTRETGHAPDLFPDLTVETPYDIDGATRIARRLLEDDAFYMHVAERAAAGLDWYRPEATAARLLDALHA